MRLTRWVLVVLVLAVLGDVEAALAWGPAVHVGLGGEVLSRLSLLPAAIAALLARQTAAYLYGSIAADIVFAKRLSRIKQFCHHWSTGFRLLDSAAGAEQKAFAWGYLSHLAADTVAHGKYVPRQVLVSGTPVNIGHLYWELRADAAEDATSWRTLEGVLAQDHGAHHATLERHITDTFLSYELNRMLFNGMNALTIRPGFRRSLQAVNRYSRWYLSPALLSGYRSECVDRILSVLRDGPRSALLHEDPNGTSALMGAHVRRREHRRLRRRGLPLHRRHAETSGALAPCGPGVTAANRA